MSSFLIIRMSAFGDVAMTIPLVYSVAKQYPNDTFYMLTHNFLEKLYIGKPDNLHLLLIDIKGKEKKLPGLLNYGAKLIRYKFDAVLDLHDVFRSKIICSILRFTGSKVFVINKGRKERKTLTQQKGKQLYPLKPMLQRHLEVLKKAGLEPVVNFTSLFANDEVGFLSDERSDTKQYRIGIAPNAKHKGKTYPLELMEEVIDYLSSSRRFIIEFFGGPAEAPLFKEWTDRFAHCVFYNGKANLEKDLHRLSSLDLLISMDSANMHFASLVNTRVLSIWGATHPFAGFLGYGQSLDDCLQIDLPCRPCSVFGNKPCLRGDWACMEQLAPSMIIERIEQIFNISTSL